MLQHMTKRKPVSKGEWRLIQSYKRAAQTTPSRTMCVEKRTAMPCPMSFSNSFWDSGRARESAQAFAHHALLMRANCWRDGQELRNARVEGSAFAGGGGGDVDRGAAATCVCETAFFVLPTILKFCLQTSERPHRPLVFSALHRPRAAAECAFAAAAATICLPPPSCCRPSPIKAPPLLSANDDTTAR